MASAHSDVQGPRPVSAKIVVSGGFDRELAEVHGDGGGRLGLDFAYVIDSKTCRGHLGFGAERLDLRHRPDQRHVSPDHRARGRPKADPQLVRDDLRQRGLAQARRSGEQRVVQRLAAGARGGDEHPEVLAQLPLADEVVEPGRAQRHLELVLLSEIGRDDAGLRHSESSLRPALSRASSEASVPSRWLAWATAPKASARP